MSALLRLCPSRTAAAEDAIRRKRCVWPAVAGDRTLPVTGGES